MSIENIYKQKLKKAKAQKREEQSPFERYGDVQYYPPQARLQIKQYLGGSSVKIDDYSHNVDNKESTYKHYSKPVQGDFSETAKIATQLKNKDKLTKIKFGLDKDQFSPSYQDKKIQNDRSVLAEGIRQKLSEIKPTKSNIKLGFHQNDSAKDKHERDEKSNEIASATVRQRDQLSQTKNHSLKSKQANFKLGPEKNLSQSSKKFVTILPNLGNTFDQKSYLPTLSQYTPLKLGNDYDQFTSVSQLRLPNMKSVKTSRSGTHSPNHTKSNVDLKNSPLKVRKERNQNSTANLEKTPLEFKTLNEEYHKIRDKVLYSINLPQYDNIHVIPEKSSKNQDFIVDTQMRYEKRKARGKLQTYMEKTHLPISLDRAKQIERDEFFKQGGTYKANMNSKTSKLDHYTIKKNKLLISEYTKREIHNHHKTALLGHDYRKIYNSDFKPQQNPFVNSKQSIHSKADPSDPLHPAKVGYQFLQNKETFNVNKYKNNDSLQFELEVTNNKNYIDFQKRFNTGGSEYQETHGSLSHSPVALSMKPAGGAGNIGSFRNLNVSNVETGGGTANIAPHSVKKVLGKSYIKLGYQEEKQYSNVKSSLKHNVDYNDGPVADKAKRPSQMSEYQNLRLKNFRSNVFNVSSRSGRSTPNQIEFKAKLGQTTDHRIPTRGGGSTQHNDTYKWKVPNYAQ